MVVITGATAGIGKDFALQLAAAGFNVFLASRTTSKLDEIAAEISECYSQAVCASRKDTDPDSFLTQLRNTPGPRRWFMP